MQKIQSFDWLHFNSNFKFKTKFNVCQFLLQNIFLNIFVFFCFIVDDAFFWFHKDREIIKNLFNLAENNFVHLLELWRNFLCGNETSSPGQPASLHLARSGSQSEQRIRRILPTRGACHIINNLIRRFVV